MEFENGRVMLVGLSPRGRSTWHRFRLTRDAPKSAKFFTFVTWRFGGSEFWRGADFVAQQKMLPCAPNDAVLRNKGVVGCARRLAGVVSSKERSALLWVEKCALFK